MPSIPLTDVLSATLIVPAVIELARTKVPADRILCGIAAALALVYGFSHYIGIRLENPAAQVIAVATGLVAVVAAIKARNPIPSTLLITTGVLIAALSIGVVAH